MAGLVKEMVDEGLVNVVGGCCGTGPEHIEAIANIVQGMGDNVPMALFMAVVVMVGSFCDIRRSCASAC